MLKLSVGLSRKVGEANYGSRGATVNLELEVESGLVRDPDQLQGKIRYLFQLARQSVEEELNGHEGQEANDRDQSNNGRQRPTNGRSATASQVRAIHAIAGRNRIDLTARLRNMFGVEQPGDLSISEASLVIDELKAQGNGAGGRR